MSRPFRIAKLLSGQERKAFRAMATDEGGPTIDALHEWLLARGHEVSRSTVHRYVMRCRRRFLATMRKQLKARSDEKIRERLAGWATQLTGTELLSVAFLAAFHVEAKGLGEGGHSKGD